MATLIDTHCHLDYDYENGKTAIDLIREAKAAGVSRFITIGTEPPRFESIQRISEQFPEVFHTVGVHPHEANTIEESIFPEIERYAKHPKCVAIGEIGLDYYYDHSPREIQKKVCQRQLEIARTLNLPIVIHSRDGEADLLPLLTEHVEAIQRSQLGQNRSPGVIHCFSGSESFAKATLALGFYISFSGILTFKNSDELRKIATKVPMDRILVETDAPFLAPVPLRGKKCEPSMVKHTALKLAEVVGKSFDEIAELTTQNAIACFRLDGKTG